MYHILGIVNQEFGKLDDALINLKKSELIIPADMDILKRKAVIYGLLDEITNAELPGIILDISRTMIYNILVSYLLVIH